MKTLISALAVVIADEQLRSQVNQLFANVPVADSNGGMTLDMGNGPIVVCHGKPSLADEKAIRQALKGINAKAKLSRTNDISQRCADYTIARDATAWKKLFGPKEETPAEKPKRQKKQTPTAGTEQTPIEQVTEHTADEPPTEPTAETQPVETVTA